MFRFHPERIQGTQILGKGGSGNIYPYKKHENDNKWVVKQIWAENTKTFIPHIQEIVLSFSFDHPNILSTFGYFLSQDEQNGSWTIYMKMPRMEASLDSKITPSNKSKIFLREEEIVQYFYAIASGLHYLHTKKVAHRDIKPANVLIRQNEIKIADIGVGKFFRDETLNMVGESKIPGTKRYAAPEILKPDAQLKNKDFCRTDIWSLGVLMAELCLQEKLSIIDPSLSDEENETRLTQKFRESAGKYKPELIELILSLIRFDPLQRNNLENVLTTLKEKIIKPDV